MRKKELDAIQARLAAIPGEEARLLLATGRYVGEGFDDARLDTLFWRCLSRGTGRSRSTSVGCIASLTTNGKCASTTTQI